MNALIKQVLGEAHVEQTDSPEERQEVAVARQIKQALEQVQQDLLGLNVGEHELNPIIYKITTAWQAANRLDTMHGGNA